MTNPSDIDEPVDTTSILDKVQNLPSLPTVATRVVNATTDEAASVKAVSELIEKDISLTARILQVVNSSLYSFNREIDSVEDAVGLMGFRQVGNLALGISVVGAFPHTDVYGFSYSEFWERSLSSAVAAVITAGRLPRLRESGIFTSSLLQDIGTCVLVDHFPLAYGNAEGIAHERRIHRVHAEREILGIDHAELGAQLAERWNLPAGIQSVIRHHHFTEFDTPPELNGSGNQVKLASLGHLFTDVHCDMGDSGLRPILDRRAREHFELTPGDVAAILAELPREMESVRSLFDRGADEDSESSVDPFHERCPKCSSAAEIRFCGECGHSLLKSGDPGHAGGTSYKVLVAEDSEAIRTALVSLLRKRGYRVVVALDGEEAVNLTGKENPDLVLMDIRMPVLDGIQALRRIRADVRSQDTPVVMLTSVTSIDTVTEAINAGANDYIAKPFTIKKLLNTVEKYIAVANEDAVD